MMMRHHLTVTPTRVAMSIALKLFEQLTDTTDDRERLRLIADAIGSLEDSWPRPADVARTADVRESELRLLKEIESVRRETESVRKETESVRRETESIRKETESIRKEIESVRKEAAESEARLRRDIEQIRQETAEIRRETEQVRRATEQVRLETERVRGEVGAAETRLQQSLHRQTVWIIGAVGAVVGLIRLLDYLLQ
jgi:chromosome segregation ATPase